MTERAPESHRLQAEQGFPNAGQRGNWSPRHFSQGSSGSQQQEGPGVLGTKPRQCHQTPTPRASRSALRCSGPDRAEQLAQPRGRAGRRAPGRPGRVPALALRGPAASVRPGEHWSRGQSQCPRHVPEQMTVPPLLSAGPAVVTKHVMCKQQTMNVCRQLCCHAGGQSVPTLSHLCAPFKPFL